MTSERPKLDEFQKAIGSQHILSVDDGSVTLTLVEVNPLTVSKREGGGFSLLFSASQDTPLEQMTYPVKSDLLDELLFVVPVDADEEKIYYESVFN